MKLKKILIPLSVISLTIPFGMPIMAAEEKTTEKTIVSIEEDVVQETQENVAVEKKTVQIKEMSETKNSEASKETSKGTSKGTSKEISKEKPFTGYKKEDGVEYYYVDGKKYTGKRKVDGETFYFSKGVKTKKYLIIEGKETEVPLKGNQWFNIKGYWHFVQNGTLIKGWKNMDKSAGEKIAHWSYFDKTNGRLYTGWHKMGNKEGEKVAHWSYFGPNGWLRTGWQSMGKGTNNPDGNQPKHMSYFGNNGWLRTGWVKLGKGTSEPDGNSAVHWSYFGDNGWLRTGWKQMGTKANPDGKSKVHWSYFGSNGWLHTGWKYFTSADGEKKNHWSYFGDNGWLATGYAKVNNVHCTFSNTGWLNKTEMDVYEYVDQEKDGYHQGCAGACLLMALKMKGKLRDMSYVYFMEKEMPYASDGNPNHGYIGNPKLRGSQIGPNNRCAILAPALAVWGQRYYKNTSNISGCSVDKLIDETRQGGIPVVMVTYKFLYNGVYPQAWGPYLLGHHFNTVVGYDYVNDRFKVADPNTPGTGQGKTRWVDGKTFRNIWNIQKGAILLK